MVTRQVSTRPASELLEGLDAGECMAHVGLQLSLPPAISSTKVDTSSSWTLLRRKMGPNFWVPHVVLGRNSIRTTLGTCAR
jgi:hypothetical protein